MILPSIFGLAVSEKNSEVDILYFILPFIYSDFQPRLAGIFSPARCKINNFNRNYTHWNLSNRFNCYYLDDVANQKKADIMFVVALLCSTFALKSFAAYFYCKNDNENIGVNIEL